MTEGRGKAKTLDPLSLPIQLQTALDALYGHYQKTFELMQKANIDVPPCFIVVCNNISTSKLVYDYISGFHRENDDGKSTARATPYPAQLMYQELADMACERIFAAITREKELTVARSKRCSIRTIPLVRQPT